MSTYLIVNILALSMPFLLSFDKKVHFYSQWKYLFPSIVLTMGFFIPWDILFTLKGIWGFNPNHIQGIFFLHLPVEEWLFFIVIPYASVFTYEVLNAYIKKDYFKTAAPSISIFLILTFSGVALLNLEKTYTTVSFFMAAFAILLLQFVFKARFMGRFYLTYLIVLIPFFIVNGILTGSYINGEVVWYNNQQNLDIRLFTIPIEDSAYGLLLILMNLGFYNFFKKRFSSSKIRLS